MTPLSAVLIGGESLLIHCAKLWLERGHGIAAVVTGNPEIATWAESTGLPVVTPGPGLESRLEPGFDWLLSIANLSLIPSDVLAMAQAGAINFHDGPLPRHAGLNAPVWALLEGETRHGITWHVIEEGVDTGDIVLQPMFDILPGDTAFDLNARCYATALDSFPSLIAQIEAGLPHRRPQDPAQRSLHRKGDRPAAMGRLDFTQDAEAICRLVRALDHGGYANPLTAPKIETAQGVFLVGAAEPATGEGQPGTVLSISDDALSVACAGGAVTLSGLTCPFGLPPGPVAEAGQVLPAADTESLDRAMARIAAGESLWAERLAGLALTELATGRGEGGQRDLPGIPAHQAAAALSAYAPGGWAYAGRDLAATQRDAPGHVAPWLPLALDGAALADRLGQIHALAGLAARHPGWPRDLIARRPELTPPATPALGLSETGAAIPRCTLTVIATEAGCRIESPSLPAAELDLWAARIRHLSAADPEAEIETLDLIAPEEAAILERINTTETPFDALTLAQSFEAQVARTPDAVALVHDRLQLSYAELNARANRAAHVLRAMGVGPDTPVALCTKRGPEMLIGALAILKAGGAYVPMDPAYPADRLAHYLSDSTAPVIVTQTALTAALPPHTAELLVLDANPRIVAAPAENPEGGAGPENLAYLIYTSGSTGLPKGVMIEHRNVANFFKGMDAHIRHDPPGVWLALTSLNFDISVLELFWTLSRGFKVVLTGEDDRLALSSGRAPIGGMDFGLFYWGNDDGPGPQKYELLLEGAKFADTHGFTSVWTPERHFHAFGGPYPNPSVTGAAVAAVTKNVAVRSGSVVAPLHHPLRIAEEWAVIDNLTNGRAGLGIASGWHPVDFVLRPENAPPNNKAAMFTTIDQIRRLWRGEAVEFDRGGKMEAVQSLPRPVSKELPLWLTIAGNPDTWREAGEIGAHVLTHLLGQSIDEVAGKIGIYHEALRKSGRAPKDYTVTLMLHTFVGRDREQVRAATRGPMKSYLASAAALVQQYAWAFPAFKRPQGVAKPVDLDLRTLAPEEVDAILDFAFERYFEESGLFGTVEDALARVEQVKAIGVTEIACLIDYGIPTAQVLEGLWPLAEVVRRANEGATVAEDDMTLAAQIRRHQVTHLQCTPTMARLLMADDGAKAALAGVEQVMLGGEALPGQLAADIHKLTGRPALNMYGPTETTIWSSCGPADGAGGTAALGQPIANTTLHVLDDARRPVPLGAEGELWIGGEGVARGYWNRPELTAERFIANPFGPGRIYATGDKVRIRPDGTIDFLGRGDGQVKIRGHRIELGEVEAALDALPGVTGSVVLARQDQPGEARLVGYVTGSADPAELARLLAERLPAAMRPARIMKLERFPETPNRKIDRKALPAPEAIQPLAAKPAPAPQQAVALAAPAAPGETAARIAEVWQAVLGVPQVGPQDHFFHLGGHSLLAVQAHRQMRQALSLPGLSITDVFRFPVLADLAAHIDARLRPQRPMAVVATQAPATPSATAPAPERAATAAPEPANRLDAMARRRAMRAERLGRTG